jgi:hypothetical protein
MPRASPIVSAHHGFGIMATPQGDAPALIFVITDIAFVSTTVTSFEGPFAV